MSKEEQKILLQDIQSVQDLIETCLKLYMNQSEVMSRLLDHAKIEPHFTQQVWKSLEAQNQDFFRAYHMRLMVKDQILQFNQLLERQVELTQDSNQTRPVSIPISNGSHNHSMHNLVYRAEVSRPYMKTEDVHQVTNTIPNVYANGMESIQPSMLVNMMGHGARLDVPSNMPVGGSSSVGMMQGYSGATMKADSHYPVDSPIVYAATAADNSLLQQPRNGIGGRSVAPINGSESNGRALHESMLNPVMDSLGFLGQMARNFSFSDDLMADFSNTADVLASYSRSPFLGIDANFLDTQIRDKQQDIMKRDATFEEFSYKDFGSD